MRTHDVRVSQTRATRFEQNKKNVFNDIKYTERCAHTPDMHAPTQTPETRIVASMNNSRAHVSRVHTKEGDKRTHDSARTPLTTATTSTTTTAVTLYKYIDAREIFSYHILESCEFIFSSSLNRQPNRFKMLNLKAQTSYSLSIWISKKEM